MKKLVLALVLLLCGIVINAAEVEAYRIAKIHIIIHDLNKGADADDAIVRERLKIKVNEIFSQNDFDEDLKTLSKTYSKVDPTIEYINNEAFITLNLWPKPVINKISWNGNTELGKSKLQKELGVKVGDLFDQSAFKKDFQKVKRLYVKEGFYEAELSYRVDTEESTNKVNIIIDVKEGKPGKVKEILFTGVTEGEKKRLLKDIFTKEYFFLTSWYTNEGQLIEEALDQDRLKVLSYLQDLGYANARVETKVIELKQKDRVNIEFICEKGEKFTIHEVSIEGNELFDQETIRKYMFVQTGIAYSPALIRQTIENISHLYGAKGYIETLVTYHPFLISGKNEYDITFKIQEGKQYRVGLIKIRGNMHTQDDVILHESLIEPGEMFNSLKLKKTEQRLKNIGYFDSVNVYALRDSSLGPNFRDVQIEVTEGNTGNIGFFVGFSTLSSIFGGIDITERNFNYKGLSRLFSEGPSAIRGAGETTRLRANIGRKEYSYYYSWTKPYFMDTQWSVGFDLQKSGNRMISNNYDLESYSAGLFAGYQLNRFVRFGWNYRFKNNTTRFTPTGGIDQEEVDAINRDGIVSSTGVSLAYDSTNHPFEPNDGFRSRLGVDCAGVGGDYTFFGTNYVNSYFYPVSSRGILRARFDVHCIFPVSHTTFDKLPLEERLYMGGETTVRGYRPYSIGDKFNLTNDPRGGLGSTLLSIEYMHNVVSRVQLFGFVDSGQVSRKSLVPTEFRSSWGVGTRVKILGQVPLNIGMGFPINPESRSDVRHFFLSMGLNF